MTQGSGKQLKPESSSKHSGREMGKLLRVHRVAALLDCCRSQVYAMVRTGELAAIKIGIRGIRITVESIEEYFAKNRVDPHA